MATRTKKAVETNGNGHVNRVAEHLPEHKASGSIAIPVMKMGWCSIEIIGTSDLLVHRFSEKARKQMEDKQQKVATTAKEKRNPEEDYFQSMYVLSGDPRNDSKGVTSEKCKAIHGMPCGGIRKAMIRAGKSCGAVMTDLRGAFFVEGDGFCDGTSMVKLDFDRVERFDAPVTLQGSTRDMRYRARYVGWRCLLKFKFNASAIGIAQLVNLLRVAGFGVGVCEWRPECDGELGCFTTGKVADLGETMM